MNIRFSCGARQSHWRRLPWWSGHTKHHARRCAILSRWPVQPHQPRVQGWHKHGKAQAISTTADRRSHEGSPPSGAMAAATLDQGDPSGCDAEHAGNPNRKMALGQGKKKGTAAATTDRARNGCYFKQADCVFIPPGQGSSSASTTWSNSDAEPLQGRMNSS